MGSSKPYKKYRPGGSKIKKIKASLDKKLKNIQWGEYRIGDLFEVKSSKKIFHANNIEIMEEKILDSYPYVVRKTGENGIRGYIKQSEEFLNPKNTLSFAQDTFTVFYQKEKYFTGNNVKILVPKFSEFNESIGIFFVGIFKHLLSNFSWGTGSTKEWINSFILKLPIKNGEIDFEFMDAYISELEEERISELAAYLTVSGLDNYKLSTLEREALDLVLADKLTWAEFRIGDLFEKIKTKNLKMKVGDLSPRKTEKFNLPVLTAGIENQGLNNYAPKANATILKNVISISANGANTGATFYQSKEFTVLQDAYAISCKLDFSLNDNHNLFLTGAIRKSIYGNFAWTDKAGWEKVKKEFIQLPTKNGEIDFEFINTLISAVQKLVIKDVVLYADKKIQATKEVVKRK
ncbi:restriction endonuclease subunit S [Gemella sp. zg-570]|uniref:restriction endonuclease subunit S n=1 Tax=Gemella sp. zg-570 TaxID=2840371 RepID=UPI001C0BC4E9|nr:restriction endonuclease subunit S [Gemella sp. zg-570]QWQ39023.1 restriction endonuclease subunit S [Gemella sp. zg-570]